MTTIILAEGKNEAVTPDIVVAEDQVVTVGIFSSAEGFLPWTVSFYIEQLTPGLPNRLGTLTSKERSMRLQGPCTYRIRREAYEGHPFGVFRSDAP